MRLGLPAGAIALLAAAGLGSAVVHRSHPRRRAWGAPQQLVPPESYTFAPKLAVSEDGQTIAAWYSGTRRQVCACGMVPARRRRRRHVPRAIRPPRPSGTKVVVDPGTVQGGFQKPIVLSDNGTDEEEGLRVAVSGSHVAYAAWTEDRRGWRVVALHGRRASRPVWLPHTAQLRALLTPPRGPVLAVWAQFPPPHRWSLDYAPLTASGRLGKTVKIAAVEPQDSAEARFAVNDSGELAATWMRGGRGPRESRAMLVVCTPRGPCSPPQALRSPGAAPEYEEPAVAVGGDGIVTALLAGHDSGVRGVEMVGGRMRIEPGTEANEGLWSTTLAPGRAAVKMSLLSPLGASPVAVADGAAGTAVAFEVRKPQRPGLGVALALRSASGEPFAAPVAIRGADASFPPALAANRRGRLLLAWAQHFGSGDAQRTAIETVLGAGRRLGPAQRIPGTGRSIATAPAAGIDASGDAIVLWDRGSCRSSPTCGMFASLRRG